MSIDLQDSVSAGHHAAKRARRFALDTVDAARDVDLHIPADAANKVAKRTAKRAAREAATAAHRAARRPAKRSPHRLRRVIVVGLLAGAAVGIAVAVVQRTRGSSSPHPADVAPDPFGTALTEPDPVIANV